MNQPLAAEVADLAARQASLAADLAALREFVYGLNHESAVAKGQLNHIDLHMPALLNALSSQNAAARASSQRQVDTDRAIAAIAERVEFVRQEIMFEFRYAAPGAASGANRSAPPGVAHVERDEAALAAIDWDAPIRLNVGAGNIPKEGYTNVDLRPLVGIDLVADLRGLPFDPGAVEEIYAAHVLEHFPEEELRRVVLPHWNRLLGRGGLLTVVVPDAESMLHAHAAGELSFDDLRLVTFGLQEYEGDFHFTMFSHASLSHLLKEGGFTDVEVVEAGRRNGLCLEMVVQARTPTSATR